MRSVQRAFGGLYKEVNRETQQWYTDTGPVPEPRPGTVGASLVLAQVQDVGQPLTVSRSRQLPQHSHPPAHCHVPWPSSFLFPQCITSHTRHLKINSSLQMPDRVLNFIKDHFLMDSPVRSQPLLLQSRLRYQQIGVHRAQGLHSTYDVLFLGTGGCSCGLPMGRVLVCCVPPAPLSTALVFADDGRLHKAVRVNHGVHIIEEIRLFPAGQPVLQLLLDQDQAGAGHRRTGAGARRGDAVGSVCIGQVLFVGWGPGSPGGQGCAGANPAAWLRGWGCPLTPLCPLP